MPVFGRGERMVRGGVTLGFVVVFKHGEVHNPQGAPCVFKQTVLFTEFTVSNFDAQSANGVVHDLGLVGTKENQIAIFCAGAFQHFGYGCIMDVFNDRALQTIAAFCQLVDLDISQTFGTINFDKFGVAINFATAHATGFARSAGYAKCNHAAAFHGGSARENFEIHIGHDVGDFCELQFHTQIRLV